ncbi:hypothetical protein D1007_38111 [Hordeum vulgare]|nr:hypothetical protein D1007_38111 [Hordeum vulgare]
MAMDDLSWPRNPRPQHAEGVAIAAGWASTCGERRTATPPPVLGSVRSMQPWPGQGGAHCTHRSRLRPRKGKRKWEIRPTTAPHKAALPPIPRPTGSKTGAGAPTLVA